MVWSSSFSLACFLVVFRVLRTPVREELLEWLDSLPALSGLAGSLSGRWRQTSNQHQSKDINSLVTGRCGSNFRSINFKLIIQKSSLGSLAWCHQTTSSCLSQCQPWSMSPYGIIRSQWYRTRGTLKILWNIDCFLLCYGISKVGYAQHCYLDCRILHSWPWSQRMLWVYYRSTWWCSSRVSAASGVCCTVARTWVPSPRRVPAVPADAACHSPASPAATAASRYACRDASLSLQGPEESEDGLVQDCDISSVLAMDISVIDISDSVKCCQMWTW